MSVVNSFGYNYHTAAFLNETPEQKVYNWIGKQVPAVFKPWEARSFHDYIHDAGEFAMEQGFDQVVKGLVGAEATVPLMAAEALGIQPKDTSNTVDMSKTLQKESQSVHGAPPQQSGPVDVPDRYARGIRGLGPETPKEDENEDPAPEETPIGRDRDENDSFAIM